MAATIHQVLNNGGTFIAYTTLTTNYLPLSNGVPVTNIAVEAQNQVVYRTGGVLSNLSVYVSGNGSTGTGTTFTTRNTGVTGNLSILVLAATTGRFEDLVNTDTVAASSKMAYMVLCGTIGGSSNSITVPSISTNFTPSASTVKRMVSNNSTGSIGVNNVTAYYALAGGMATGTTIITTESTVQYVARLSGKLKNFQVYMRANTGKTGTFGTRVNGANGSLTVSVGTSATGLFEDTTHTDNFASGDLLNYIGSMSGGASSSAAISVISAELSTTNNTFVYLSQSVVTSTSSNNNYWLALDGGIFLTLAAGTEVRLQVAPKVGLTVANLQLRVTSNGYLSGTVPVVFRKNSTSTSLALSIPFGATGVFEDLVNTVHVNASDLINLNTTGAAVGTGNMSFSMYALTAQVDGSFDASAGLLPLIRLI